MFDYDKVINKLGKFDELSEKKQKKWLRVIFCEKDFREWFYGVGDSATDQRDGPADHEGYGPTQAAQGSDGPD